MILNDHTSNQPDLPFEPRKSKRVRIEKNLGEDLYTFLIEDTPISY